MAQEQFGQRINEMGWKIVACPVCESSVVVREGEEAKCPHCGELLEGEEHRFY